MARRGRGPAGLMEGSGAPDAAYKRGKICRCPAGRFEARPGRNDKGEDIVWIDYAASLALHRLRPAPVQERRPARLDSPSPDDNRISAGCVIVPVAFYEGVVAPTLGSNRSVIYVLPETHSPRGMFEALALDLL